MSESHNDGHQYPGRARPVGTSAALFERAPTPMAAVRGDEPTVEVVNRAYLERFEGRRPESGDGGSFRHGAQLGGIERDLVRAAAEGTVERDVVSRTTPDGRRSFAVRAIPADRVEIDVYLQYRDVTAERIRDQQLAVLRRVLRHDLRNDLTVLLGYAETIAETASDPTIREQASTMLEAASDLRSVATSAGRMQCVTAVAEWIELDDAVAKTRRTVSGDGVEVLPIDGTVPSQSVDRRVAVALEALCRTLFEQADASELEISADVGDGWSTVTLEADAALSEQALAALKGRDETKLRHATGISPWIARWAVRAAGGTLHVDADDDSCTVALAAPVRETDPARGTEESYRARSWADD